MLFGKPTVWNRFGMTLSQTQIERQKNRDPGRPVSAVHPLGSPVLSCLKRGEGCMENAPGCQMAESFGTSSLVGCEHIYQVQCFYVESVEIPWFLGTTIGTAKVTVGCMLPCF